MIISLVQMGMTRFMGIQEMIFLLQIVVMTHSLVGLTRIRLMGVIRALIFSLVKRVMIGSGLVVAIRPMVQSVMTQSILLKM